MTDTNPISNFIKLLNSLVTITKNQGEHFKSVAYTKAINELAKYLKSTQNGTKVLSSNDLKKLKLPNIGKTILEKYEEFLKTGTLEAITKEKNNPVNIFTNIYERYCTQCTVLPKSVEINSLYHQDDTKGRLFIIYVLIFFSLSLYVPI